MSPVDQLVAVFTKRLHVSAALKGLFCLFTVVWRLTASASASSVKINARRVHQLKKYLNGVKNSWKT